MEGSAWLVVGDAAERYRRLAERVRDERSAWLLRMASRVLEEAAYRLMTGRAGLRDIEDLRTVERLLRGRGLPVEPLRMAERVLASAARRRVSGLAAEALDLIGLPA